jgi:hypothetical protein
LNPAADAEFVFRELTPLEATNMLSVAHGRCQEVLRKRALQRQNGGVIGEVLQGDRTVIGKVLGEPRPHHVDHRGVGNAQYFRIADHGEDHVVDEITVLVEKMGVSTPTRCNARHPLGGQTFEPGSNAFTRESERTHVRYVEEASTASGRQMFISDVGVPDGQLKAVKIDEVGFQRDVLVVEGGSYGGRFAHDRWTSTRHINLGLRRAQSAAGKPRQISSP